MATCRFPSLEHPEKYGFVFDSQNYVQRPPVDECCLAFETYGDGLCQHSGEWPIAADLAADYFASLAAHLLEHPDELDWLSWKLRQDVSPKDIDFAASVVYREPKENRAYKRQYYSRKERKLTTADKRNDRRYDEVESWMDGSPDAIVRLLWQSFYSPLQTYALNCAVRDWTQAGENSGWMDIPTITADADHDARRALHDAYKLLQSVLRHLEGLRSARSSLDCWLRNLENRKQQAAPAVAA
jgi:hypothetical protein